MASAHAQAFQEFPWLATDADAEALTNAKLRTLLEGGAPKTIATIRKAATEVAKRLGIGGRQAPTDRQRQAFTGTRGGEGGGGEGSERVTLDWNDRATKKLAQLRFPRLSGAALRAAYEKMIAEHTTEE